MDPLIDPLTNALLHRNWSVLTGFVIVFLVSQARKRGYTKKLDKKFLPLVSVGLGIVLSVGDSFINAAASSTLQEILVKGVVAGLSATGFWELAFKHYKSGEPELPGASTEQGEIVPATVPAPSPASPEPQVTPNPPKVS